MMAYCCFRYETMARFSPCIYLPFYIVAIYALIMEKEWIRIPCEFAYVILLLLYRWKLWRLETLVADLVNYHKFAKVPSAIFLV